MIIDDTDRTILQMLQNDARIANAEIARHIGLAPSAIFQRIRKMEELGVIEGYTARLNPTALGYGLTAFVMIQTREGARAPEVTRDLASIPEVIEVHRVVGQDCFFLKVRVRDPKALEALLDEKIQPIPSVAATRTTIVLSTGKESGAIPLGTPASNADAA